MCGRFALETPLPELAEIFGAAVPDDRSDLPPRYNIAPTQPMAVVRARAAQEEGVAPVRELALLRWGLLPSWVEDPEDWPTLINARAETLDRKPAFQDALRFRRCLVPADGFFEWRREGGGKQPYFVRAAEEGPIAFAGLWERWVGADEAIETCAIVTTEANELLRPIHDRMPVILEGEARTRWMDPHLRTHEALEELLRPFPSEKLVAYPVSRVVNRADADGPVCIEPLEGRGAWRGEPPPGEVAGEGAVRAAGGRGGEGEATRPGAGDRPADRAAPTDRAAPEPDGEADEAASPHQLDLF